ncbi:MAG: glycosyltransferase family 39 protein [Chitinophagales bacterium]
MFSFFSDKPYTQKSIWYLLLIAFVLLFGNNWVSLWDQDESAYAGFAKHMLESGNWLMPEFIWSEVHRKPPLHFWNIAISYKIFGINEFAVRFPSAVFILLTIAAVFFLGKRLFGEKQSFYGMVVLSSSFLVMALAKISVTDATLLFFTSICGFAMLYVLLFREFKWVLVFWISFALALLTKGPPVIIFTAVLSFLLFVFHPNRKQLLRLHPWFFLPLSAMPLFLWGWMCTQEEGGQEFISWMIDWYILKRVGGSVFGQTGPPGTHLLGMALFFLPYLLFFPKAIYKGVINLFGKEKDQHFLLSAWFISAWLIFEFSPSKLPAYVVAAHVPLALIIARLAIDLKENRPGKVVQALHFGLNFILLLALAIAPFILELSNALKIIFLLGSLAFIIANVFLVNAIKKAVFVKYLLSINVAFQLVLWCLFLPFADEVKNATLRVAQYIEQSADQRAEVIIANKTAKPPSLPFYLMQRFEKVSEEYDFAALEEMYNKAAPCALVLNHSLKDQFEDKYPNLNFKEIKPLPTDKIKQPSYFILLNH